MQHRTDTQWIEVLAHYFATQQPIMVKTRGVTTREAIVTCMHQDYVRASARLGAEHEIPYGAIEEVRRIGDTEVHLDHVVRQHLYQCAAAMARGVSLRIETADDCIEQAAVRWLTLSSVHVIDVFNGVTITVPLTDIELLSADAELAGTVPDHIPRDDAPAALLTAGLPEPISLHARQKRLTEFATGSQPKFVPYTRDEETPPRRGVHLPSDH